MAANGRPGRWLGERRRVTAWRILRSGDLAGLVRRTVAFLGRLGHRPTPVDYDGWRRQWVEVDEAARARVDELVAALPRRPSFTVLVPVDGADEALIAATVGSVADQRYPNWVLCLTGTDSPDPTVADLMAEVGDKRVRFTGPSPTPSGEWVTRLLPGDLVHEVALFAVADAVNRNPSAALVYTDHDHVGPDGRFVDPHMKPDLNLDLLAAMDYLKVLTVYRADLWATHATMSTGAHDLAVRATARLGDGQVEHVPHVLASLRVSSEEQGRVAGLASACPSLGFVLGPLVGTSLYAVDHRFPYMLVVALMMATIVALISGRGYAMDTLLGVMAHSALAFGLVGGHRVEQSVLGVAKLAVKVELCLEVVDMTFLVRQQFLEEIHRDVILLFTADFARQLWQRLALYGDLSRQWRPDP